MSLVPGSPDIVNRSLPSWPVPESGENITEALQALDTYKKKDPSKGWSALRSYSVGSSMLIKTFGFRHDLTVVVRFKAVGNAPIMKTNFYKITASNRFQAVIQFLRKELGWKSGDPLVSLLIS
jgi:ubiquitin-like protein ATG12